MISQTNELPNQKLQKAKIYGEALLDKAPDNFNFETGMWVKARG